MVLDASSRVAPNAAPEGGLAPKRGGGKQRQRYRQKWRKHERKTAPSPAAEAEAEAPAVEFQARAEPARSRSLGRLNGEGHDVEVDGGRNGDPSPPRPLVEGGTGGGDEGDGGAGGARGPSRHYHKKKWKKKHQKRSRSTAAGGTFLETHPPPSPSSPDATGPKEEAPQGGNNPPKRSALDGQIVCDETKEGTSAADGPARDNDNGTAATSPVVSNSKNLTERADGAARDPSGVRQGGKRRSQYKKWHKRPHHPHSHHHKDNEKLARAAPEESSKPTKTGRSEEEEHMDSTLSHCESSDHDESKEQKGHSSNGNRQGGSETKDWFIGADEGTGIRMVDTSGGSKALEKNDTYNEKHRDKNQQYARHHLNRGKRQYLHRKKRQQETKAVQVELEAEESAKTAVAIRGMDESSSGPGGKIPDSPSQPSERPQNQDGQRLATELQALKLGSEDLCLEDVATNAAGAAVLGCLASSNADIRAESDSESFASISSFEESSNSCAETANTTQTSVVIHTSEVGAVIPVNAATSSMEGSPHNMGAGLHAAQPVPPPPSGLYAYTDSGGAPFASSQQYFEALPHSHHAAFGMGGWGYPSYAMMPVPVMPLPPGPSPPPAMPTITPQMHTMMPHGPPPQVYVEDGQQHTFGGYHVVFAANAGGHHCDEGLNVTGKMGDDCGTSGLALTAWNVDAPAFVPGRRAPQ